MGTAYHNEALRKKRMLERKQEAVRAIAQSISKSGPGDSDKADQAKIVFSEPGHYEQNRGNLDKFRLGDEGFNNRYRQRQHFYPHCDLAYAVVYPGKDNSDYTADENRTFRRLNINADKYAVARRINGDFHVQVLKEMPE